VDRCPEPAVRDQQEGSIAEEQERRTIAQIGRPFAQCCVATTTHNAQSVSLGESIVRMCAEPGRSRGVATSGIVDTLAI
jgi:hypothetical protein